MCQNSDPSFLYYLVEFGVIIGLNVFILSRFLIQVSISPAEESTQPIKCSLPSETTAWWPTWAFAFILKLWRPHFHMILCSTAGRIGLCLSPLCASFLIFQTYRLFAKGAIWAQRRQICTRYFYFWCGWSKLTALHSSSQFRPVFSWATLFAISP